MRFLSPGRGSVRAPKNVRPQVSFPAWDEVPHPSFLSTELILAGSLWLIHDCTRGFVRLANYDMRSNRYFVYLRVLLAPKRAERKSTSLGFGGEGLTGGIGGERDENRESE